MFSVSIPQLVLQERTGLTPNELKAFVPAYCQIIRSTDLSLEATAALIRDNGYAEEIQLINAFIILEVLNAEIYKSSTLGPNQITVEITQNHLGDLDVTLTKL